MGALGAFHTSTVSISLTAPSSEGTYHYGACVDNVSGESADNNCSRAANVTVAEATGGDDTTYGVGETLPNYPSGFFSPAVVSGATVRISGGRTTISINNGGFVQLQDETRYTCIASGGCSVEEGRVTSGTIRVTTGSSGGGDSGGTPPSSTSFALDSNNRNPAGITYVNNRFYVVDDKVVDDKVYVYTSSWQRVSSSDFALDSNNSWPDGITYVNNRFYMVDDGDDKVYVYTNSGQRVASADFDLDSNNSEPRDITYANNRFYVLDRIDNKVYVYTNSGQRVASADFDLVSSYPNGMTYANNRFYVVDTSDAKVYVYTNSGQRVASADFDLDNTNANPGSIIYANNRFYVFDWAEKKVYVYSDLSGSGGSSSPDLIVASPSVSDNTLTPRQSFTLRATVRNLGTGQSASTTLRYYSSSDSTISTSDTQVGTDVVSGLSASGTSAESISLNAPSSAGTYYYGACVESVSGESNTNNNCSDGVRVTVSSSGGGTPPPSGDAVTGSITNCSATLDGFIYKIRIAGTVRAIRSVSFLTLRGYVGSSFVGIASLGSMSAGQAQSFTITGISGTEPSGRCRVDMDWLEGGSKSQGVVDKR